MRDAAYLLCFLIALVCALFAILMVAIAPLPDGLFIAAALFAVFVSVSAAAQTLGGTGPPMQRARAVGSIALGVVLVISLQLGYRACGVTRSECTTMDAFNDRCPDPDEPYP